MAGFDEVLKQLSEFRQRLRDVEIDSEDAGWELEKLLDQVESLEHTLEEKTKEIMDRLAILEEEVDELKDA